MEMTLRWYGSSFDTVTLKQIQDSFPPLLECSQTQEVSSLFQDTNISAEFSAIKLETG